MMDCAEEGLSRGVTISTKFVSAAFPFSGSRSAGLFLKERDDIDHRGAHRVCVPTETVRTSGSCHIFGLKARSIHVETKTGNTDGDRPPVAVLQHGWRRDNNYVNCIRII